MSLKETLQKQGGLKLLKQYARGGALFTAAGEFLLLGKSRTALEILRLSAWLKIKQKLEKTYRRTLEEFEASYDPSLAHQQSNKIWICWFQGIENAPLVVQKCVQSVRDRLPGREIVILTADNLQEYAQFPEHIWRKWQDGTITHTHMTDLLRMELLIRHGGMWLDATVLCTDDRIPAYFFDSELFFYQTLKPGRDGLAAPMSSWLISAKTNNKLLMACRHLCYEYWKHNDDLVDYYLFHDFFAIVLDRYPEQWHAVVPVDSAAPHILLLRLFDRYDQRLWDAIRQQTPFHKLTYKFTEEEAAKPGTFYDVLINQ